MTTILHVEDDESLAEMVAAAFEAFGFRGATVTATTVEKARAILEDDAGFPAIDLIISDMHLPDGTGLDVVRAVRASRTHAHVPILILSGETDPEKIDRAYALGASSYVSKGIPGRSVTEMVKALHDHWLKDVHLPRPHAAVHTRDLLAISVELRTRAARACMAVAEQLGAGSELAGFWMDFALRAGNLAHLLSFLLGQIGDRELSEQSREDVQAIQARERRWLDELEGHPVKTSDEAERFLAALVSNATVEAEPIARALGQLFPVAPVATAALYEVAASTLEATAAWIEAHPRVGQLGAHAPQLRAGAARLRAARAA